MLMARIIADMVGAEGVLGHLARVHVHREENGRHGPNTVPTTPESTLAAGRRTRDLEQVAWYRQAASTTTTNTPP